MIFRISSNETQTNEYERLYNQLDKILDSLDAKVLINSGKISHDKAIEKVKIEWKKYQVKELTGIEKEYLKSFNEIHNIVDNIDKNNNQWYIHTPYTL